ncbi:MAG TPA: Ig-like domain-containing protein, partial [Anaerolineae bacterium]|nr:Ig-like domain-containing protein [Anaerolineae bacterium]
HTQTWGGALTETTWSFAWTPATEGDHVLAAVVRDADGAVLTQTTPITVYVDTTAPTVAVAAGVLTTTHYRPSGEVGLTGTVADAGGVQNVIVEVTAADGTFLHGTLADVAGTTWRAPWIVDVTALPAGETYTITAVAADLAGRVVTATRAITVDLSAPTTMTLGLSGDFTQPPATVSLTWTASSDASGLGDYRGVWQTWLTDTAATTAFTRPAFGPRSVTTTVQEGQKLVAQVAAQDAYGNQTWQTYGPVYADGPATPDYAALEYRGWMETGCTALGTDARIRDKAAADASLKAAQQFYLTWDSAALRMTWTGASWDSDGDLFVYLDTQPGGATQAYNPYPATINSTAILLPVQRTISVTHQAAPLSPRAARATAAEQMEADALIWVRDSVSATLLLWNGSAWTAADGLAYAFDATLDAPTTDLRVPFDALGITDPATATLALVAFAAEDDALRLWATMPPLNSVNSPRILDAKLTGDVERFALTHRYDWATLGDGVCVNASQAVGRGPHAPQAAPQAYNADVRFTFQAQPEGIAYSVLEDNNFFLMDNLSTFESLTNWDAWDAEFCAEFPDDPECQRELEAKPAGTRAPQQGGSGLDFNAQNGLGSAQDTAHPPVGHGDTIVYTFSYTNRGTARATGLIADIITWGPVRLPDAQEHYVDETEETYYLTLDLGDLDPGQTRTATFTGQIDVTCDITNNVGWATLDISLYDDSTSLEAPLDWVYVDHEVDQSGPLITLQADPALVAPGVNLLHGLMVDASSVATITLQIEDPWGETTMVEFHDATLDDGRWEYAWDIGAAEEGDQYAVAVMAEDIHGQVGAWSRWVLLTVDATRPILTLSSATEAALEDGIIGLAETTFTGGLSDNRLAEDVQACRGTLCDSANTLLDAATVSQTTFAYDDAPAAPLPINAGIACEGGTPIFRTFTVSDAFVVADVAVGLNITHEFRYDVDVTLISPAGTEVNILWDGTDAQNYDVLLSDDALALNADDWQDHDPAAPYYETVIRPDEPLEALAGEEAQGTWELRICDYSPEEDDGAYNRSRLVLIADGLPENTAAAWSYTVPLSDAVDGALQTVTFYGLDSAGNRSASTVRTFRADNVAPVVTVTSALAEIFWGTQTPVLGGLASDGTGVAHVTIVGQTPAKTTFYAAATESAAGQWEYLLADAWPGTYTLWVQAEDAAGNMSTVGPYTVHVKGAPLTLAKSVTPTVEVQPGDTVTYTLVLHNGGEETVAGLFITDTVTSTLHTLTPTPPGTLAIILGNTLTWGPLAIAAGDTYTFSFTAVVTETVGSNVLVTNQATYDAPATGPGVSTIAVFLTAQGDKIYLPLVMRNN